MPFYSYTLFSSWRHCILYHRWAFGCSQSWDSRNNMNTSTKIPVAVFTGHTLLLWVHLYIRVLFAKTHLGGWADVLGKNQACFLFPTKQRVPGVQCFSRIATHCVCRCCLGPWCCCPHETWEAKGMEAKDDVHAASFARSNTILGLWPRPPVSSASILAIVVTG